MTPVLRRTLIRERRPILGWAIGLALLVLVTVGSWPGIEQSAGDFSALMENLPEALTAFFGQGIADFSAAGIIGSRLYGTLGLGIVIAYAVSRGARGIAGEDEGGTLELLVVQPISRAAIAIDKVVALLLSLAVLVLLEMVLLLLMMPVVGLDFSIVHVLLASTGLYILAAMFGALAFAVGASTGNRRMAVGVAGGLAGALFLLTGFGSLVSALQPLADLSPFTSYDGTIVLAQGLKVGPTVITAVTAVALVAAGVLGFNRRDLS